MAVEAVIFTQIVDVNWDQAIYTASPNNTINVAQFAAKGSGTNIAVALTPKGTGYISAQVPDGTATGGNARGASSVDLQTLRGSGVGVASGVASCIVAGDSNVASGLRSATVAGFGNLSSGTNAKSSGRQCIASGENSTASGNSATASGESSTAMGVSAIASGDGSKSSGRYSRAHRLGMSSHSSTVFAVAGDCQSFVQTMACKTTTNAAVEMLLNGIFGGGSLVLLANTVLHAQVTIVGVKSDGSAVAKYMRQVCIKRVVNTTSLVGSVETIGVDEAVGTSISITADDTAESLKITATGITSETWRWIAVVEGAELGIGA